MKWSTWNELPPIRIEYFDLGNDAGDDNGNHDADGENAQCVNFLALRLLSSLLHEVTRIAAGPTAVEPVEY